ncbi:FadR family transcriptional regulator [Antribacter sp. KLBMP9083]|uniref:FadR family transcriptional regulator n=1 Tax=Antribacter soli TaxID=2910976 RepID=A0AA41QCV9_9MICO|nr:FadR/GntR family transcriptional regulator [Antribacter soli]MCF4120291.1 FadR family transcriptional regulator [Antribacter soli]
MSRTDDVVDGIKRMIFDGELGPGDKLPVEKDLAERLGVSRGSLREGVRALSILGILDTRQGDGTYVTSLDPSRLLSPLRLVVDLHGEAEAQPFHAVRRVLETEAAGLAARRITPGALAEARALLDRVAEILGRSPVDHAQFIQADVAFHRIIAGQAGNPVLEALIETLASRTVRERLQRGRDDERAEPRTAQDHEAIWRALAAGDAEGARVRMAAHLLDVEESLR